VILFSSFALENPTAKPHIDETRVLSTGMLQWLKKSSSTCKEPNGSATGRELQALGNPHQEYSIVESQVVSLRWSVMLLLLLHTVRCLVSAHFKSAYQCRNVQMIAQ
jgi:hypothetical protein